MNHSHKSSTDPLELKKLLRAKRIKQEYLAFKIGVSRVYLNKVLNGHNTLTEGVVSRINQIVKSYT